MKRVLRAWLMADLTVFGLVGPRIYVRPVPPGAVFPYLVMARLSHRQPITLSSYEESVFELWQIDCYSDIDIVVEAVQRAVRDRCNAVSIQNTVPYVIYGMSVMDTRDMDERVEEAADELIYRRAITIHVNRSTIET